MAIARGAWALLAMQITCYTTHIEKKSKPNKKHNFQQNKNENKKNKTHITNVILMWCTGIKPL